MQTLPQLDDQVLGLPWPDFLAWFAPRWEPGQHLNITAPTGEGKTTLGTGILSLRKWVLAFDPKGGDKTLRATGWPRISGQVDRLGNYLPREMRKNIADGLPCRVIVGNVAHTFSALELNWKRQGSLMERVFADEGWTLYVPDIQLLTDPRMGDVRRAMDMTWIAARDRDISLVTDMQAFAWTPKLARSQSRWFVVGFTRDLDSVVDLARAVGRSPSEMRGMVKALKLRPHSWIIFSNAPRDPVVVTIPEPRKLPQPSRAH